MERKDVELLHLEKLQRKVKAHNVVVKLLKEVSFGMRDPDLYAKKIMLDPAP